MTLTKSYRVSKNPPYIFFSKHLSFFCRPQNSYLLRADKNPITEVRLHRSFLVWVQKSTSHRRCFLLFLSAVQLFKLKYFYVPYLPTSNTWH